MTRSKSVSFVELRRLLEGLGYRHERVERGEIFHQSADRELYYHRYHDRDLVDARDLVITRRLLDTWGQLEATDFDAFVESTATPA